VDTEGAATVDFNDFKVIGALNVRLSAFYISLCVHYKAVDQLVQIFCLEILNEQTHGKKSEFGWESTVGL